MPTYRDAEYIKQRTLAGHSYDSVWRMKKNTDVAFVDNDTLISGGSDGKRIAWNIKTGTQLWKQGEAGNDVFNVAVPSYDPTIFVYNDGNYRIKICNTNTGELEKELEEYTTGDVVRQHVKSGGIISLAFRPYSHILASGRKDGTIRFWDADNQQHIRTLRPHISVPEGTSLAWGPDGQIIASGIHDGTVKLVYPNKTDTILYGSRFRSWIGLSSLRDFRVTALAWGRGPYGQTLASGHGDGNIVLWNVATQQKLHTLLGHKTRGYDHEWSPDVKSLAWSPDGTHLVSAQSVSQNIRLWKPDTGENFGILRINTHVSSIAFSPDGRMLASGDTISGTITIWERTN